MNLFNIFKKKKFKREKIKLLNGNSQEYFIDSNKKVHGAEVRYDNKIYVEQNFNKFSRKEQLAIIYHERGHSNFLLLKWIRFILLVQLILSTLFFFMAFGYFLITILIKQSSEAYWIFGWIFLFLSFFEFVNYVLLNWLVEIIADLNAIKNINKKIHILKLRKLYNNKKIGFWRRYIQHPPINLRIKIMEGFD